MGLSMHCIYCGKILIDVDHALHHGVNQCEKSPTKKLADALEALVTSVEADDGVNPDWPVLVNARAALVAAGRT